MKKNSKKVFMIAAIALLVVLIALCIALISVLTKDKPSVIGVQDVTLDKTAYTLEEGQEYQLEADVEPLNATDKTVSWKTSDKEVATVSSEGLVKAISKGEATITVKTTDGAKTANCKITVISATIHVEDVLLNYTEYPLETASGSLQLVATVLPENATDKTVTWKSSDDSVAVVSDEGVVTPISAGTAVITVKTNDGAETATCAITVTDPVVAVNGVELNRTETSLTVGSGTLQLVATVRPLNATDKTVTWETSDETIATVTGEGIVTPIAAGTAVITVKTNDGGITATCNITVTEASVGPDDPAKVETSNIGIEIKQTELKPGDTFDVKLEISTSRKNCIWSNFTFSVVPLTADGKTYSYEYAKNFELVKGSYKTNLPELTAVGDGDSTVDSFQEDNNTVGLHVDIALAGLNKPTSESVIIEFKVKVSDTAQEIPSFKFGVAPIARNHVDYYDKEKGVKITDLATGVIEERLNGKIVGRTKGDCFKVTPVEMKIVKDDAN